MRSIQFVFTSLMVSALVTGCNSVQPSYYDASTGMIYPAQVNRPKIPGSGLFAKKKKHDPATCPICNPHGEVAHDHAHGKHTEAHVHQPGAAHLPLPANGAITQISHSKRGQGSGVQHAHHAGGNGNGVVPVGHSQKCTCAAPRPVPVPKSQPSSAHNKGCSCGTRKSSSGHHHHPVGCGNCGGYITSGCPCHSCPMPCDPCAMMGGTIVGGGIINGGVIDSGCDNCDTIAGFGGIVSDGVVVGDSFGGVIGETFEGTVIPGQIIDGGIASGDCEACKKNGTSPSPLFNSGDSIPGNITPVPEPAKVPGSTYDEKVDGENKDSKSDQSASTRSAKHWVPQPVPASEESDDGFEEPSRLNPTTMLIPTTPQQKTDTKHVHWTPSSVPIFEIE